MPDEIPQEKPMIRTIQSLRDDNPNDQYVTYHQVEISGQLKTFPDQRGLVGKTIWVQHQQPDESWRDLFSVSTHDDGKWGVTFNGYLGYSPGNYSIRTWYPGSSRFMPSYSRLLTLTFVDGKLPSYIFTTAIIPVFLHEPYRIRGELTGHNRPLGGTVLLSKYDEGAYNQIAETKAIKGKFMFTRTEEQPGTQRYKIGYNGSERYDGCESRVTVHVQKRLFSPDQ